MPCPEKFRESLEVFGVPAELRAKINEGCEELVSGSPKKRKAAYFKRAVDIMNAEMEPETLKKVLEWNACCKGGAREKASKQFAKDNQALSFEEKLAKIREVPNMGTPVLNDDGTITIYAVRHKIGDRYACACSNFNGAKFDEPVSKNYCFCCAGHFKHHYEIMLSVKLEAIEILTSPLNSGGENACSMRFAVDG